MRVKKKSDETDLTFYITKILKERNLYSRINDMLNSYIHRVGIKQVNEVKSTKAKVTSSMRKPNMTWVIFRYILLDILNPKSVNITIDLEWDIGENSTHTFFINNRDSEDKQWSTTVKK